MIHPEHDEDFETYLKRRSVLPHEVDDRLEPPAELDHIVLQKAREALKTQAATGQGKQQLPRAARWAMPVAVAATLLLCLSVVMNISLNPNRPTGNRQRMTAASGDADVRAGADSGAEADTGEKRRAANEGELRERVAGDIPSREVILPEAKVAGSPAPQPPVVAERAPPPSGEEPRVAARTGTDKAAMFAKRANATTSGTSRAEAANSPSSEAPASAAHRPDTQSLAAVPSPNGSRDTSPGIMPSPGATEHSSPAPSSPTRARLADRQEPPEGVTRQAARTGAAAPHPADPKIWLRQIDALRAAGENDRADAEMRLFRAVFPTYAAKPAPAASSEPPK